MSLRFGDRADCSLLKIESELRRWNFGLRKIGFSGWPVFCKHRISCLDIDYRVLLNRWASGSAGLVRLFLTKFFWRHRLLVWMT